MQEPDARGTSVAASRPVPHHYQESDVSCGAAALRMALEEAGQAPVAEATLMDELGTDLQGTRVWELVRAVRRRGIEHAGWYGDVTVSDLRSLLVDHAVVVCYQSARLRVGHFAVVRAITADEIELADPWFGPHTRLPLREFEACWRSEPPGSKTRPRWMLAIRFAHT